MNPFHTPEEMIQLSNFAHWFEGGLIGIIVVVAAMYAFGLLNFKNARIIWSSAILVAGSFLVPFLMLHHGMDKIDDTWRFILQDSQQLQHLVIGILLTVAGLVELLNALKVIKSRAWEFIFPIVLAIIGIMFMTHTQHGTTAAMQQSMIFHRYLGIALVLSGIMKALMVFWKERRIIAYLWILFMAITSVMLITYREPVGTYMDQPLTPTESTTNIHKSH